MKLHHSLALGLAALALAAAPAFAVTETFSNVGNTEGWTAFSDATLTTFEHDGVGALTLGGNEYSFYYAIADANASGGVFTGDYSGFASLSFDINITDTSTLDGLFVTLSNLTTLDEWSYEFSYTTGSVISLSAPLDPSGAGWTQLAGPTMNFADMLASVDELAVHFAFNGTPSPAAGFGATLDNVTLTAIPEPAAATALAALGVAGVVGFLRRRRA
jgi:hypothetical protein